MVSLRGGGCAVMMLEVEFSRGGLVNNVGSVKFGGKKSW